jgi:hypothetical protein
VLFVLAVWADPLFFPRSFGGRDLIPYNLPMEKTIHDAYARGEFPLWSPEISGGRPLLPNPNAGAMYPVRMLLAAVRFPVAVKLFTVGHWAAAGIGLILLLGLCGVSRSAAWIGAVSYVFSGVVVSEVFFPHILPGMALLPWVVWAVRRPSPQASRVCLLSFLLALDLFAGDVFTIALAVLCAAIWILTEEPRERRRPLLLALAGAGALAALAALPQIVATAMWVGETNRAVMGIKWREALQFCVSPYRLIELVVPFPFGANWSYDRNAIWGWAVFNHKMMGLFLSLYSGALAVIALIVARKSAAPASRFARVLVLVSLLLAVPGSLIPEAWAELASPLPLRNPEKFAVLLALGLAVLAAVALDELRRRRKLPRWPLVAGVGLTLLAAAAAFFPGAAARLAAAATRSPTVDDVVLPAIRELPMALTEAALFWVLTWLAVDLARSRRSAARLLGLALLAAVPVAATRRIVWTFSESEVFAAPPFVHFLRKQDPAGQFRTVGESIYREVGEIGRDQVGNDLAFTEFARRNWTQHSQVLWDRGTVFNGDFDNGDLSRVESARKVSSIAGGFKDGGPFFGSFSLRWGTRYRDQVPLPGYHRVGGNLLEDWDENPGALPDIRLVSGWKEKPGSVAALQEISKLGRGEIVVETGREGSGTAPGGSVRVLEKSPARLLLETDAPEATWLFVLRGFWRHRTVKVDGREVEVAPAQLAFSALPVPAGKHRIEWREHFPGWSVSRAGPPLYVLALALLMVRQRRVGGAK